MAESDKTKKKIAFYDAFTTLGLSYRVLGHFEKRYAKQKHTITNWKKLLK